MGKRKRRAPRTGSPRGSSFTAVRDAAPVALAYVIFEVALRAVADSDALLGVRRVTAEWAGAVLRLAGSEVTVKGCDVIAGQGIVSVSPVCLPVTPVAIGLALMLFALKTSWPKRVAWAAVCTAVVLGTNVGRVAVVGALAARRHPLLDTVHEQVLPVVLVGVAVGVWLLAARGRRHG